MGFRLQQKMVTLNVNSMSLLCRQSCVVTKWLRPESRGFRYNKVAVYLSYLHVKYDDKTT